MSSLIAILLSANLSIHEGTISFWLRLICIRSWFWWNAQAVNRLTLMFSLNIEVNVTRVEITNNCLRFKTLEECIKNQFSMNSTLFKLTCIHWILKRQQLISFSIIKLNLSLAILICSMKYWFPKEEKGTMDLGLREKRLDLRGK